MTELSSVNDVSLDNQYQFDPNPVICFVQAASCSSSTALTFAWSVKCTQGDSAEAAKSRVEATAGYTKTSTKFALKIDSGTLLAGRTYEFTVVVALKATPSTKSTVKTSVVVEWSPLQPGIVGGKICH